MDDLFSLFLLLYLHEITPGHPIGGTTPPTFLEVELAV